MTQIAVEITGDDRKAAQAFTRLQAKVQELEAKLKNTAQAGRKGGEDMSRGMERAVHSAAALVSSYLSVQTAISAANRAHETWLTNLRETSDAAQATARSLVTLATLQEGGAKAQRVRAAAELGASFGITDQARAFDVVQTLQSAAGGDFAKGMAAARGVFRAMGLGMEGSTAQELATQGIVQGQDPEEFLRKAHVTGKISLRSPQTIAEAARGMQFFPDKNVGFAATGILAGAFREETETYVKAAGIAMSEQAGDAWKKSLTAMGLRGADPMSILRTLSGRGVDTTDELAKLGLGEIRQVHAMNTLLNNMGELERYLVEIPRQAGQPNLLAQERAGVEAELPTTRLTREIGQLEASSGIGRSLTSLAEDKLEEDRKLLMTGLALRRMGAEDFLGIDLIDERGRAKTGFLPRVAREMMGLGSALDGSGVWPKGLNPRSAQGTYQEAFEIAMKEVQEELKGAARDLKDAARSMRGGPALVPATEDN